MRILVLSILALFTVHILTVSRPAQAACANPAGIAGDMVYNETSKQLQYCNDTAWIAMNLTPGSGSGGCVVGGDTLSEGTMIYNKDHRVLSVCTGSTVQALGPQGGAMGWSFIDAGLSGHATGTCGIKNDGTLWCWGTNSYGALGNNSTVMQAIPAQVSGGGQWIDVDMAGFHACGIKANGSLWCWGRNGYGQVGDNTTTDRLVPTQVSGGGTWIDVGTGYNTFQGFSCAIKSDNTLHCWGDNGGGKTGRNLSTGSTLVPTQVSGGGSWLSLSTGVNHSCAIKTDNSLWCWGSNSTGQLGDNSITQRLVPTAVNGGGAWKLVTAGDTHTCGIKTDDSLWCWGGNSSGKTGGNLTAGNTLVPTQISGGGTWKNVSAGMTHTCAIKSNDSLWCWGSNWYGELADGSMTQSAVPVASSDSGSWKNVTAGSRRTCAIKQDNSMRCWGEKSAAGFGNNTTGAVSYPVEIAGGGLWRSISSQDDAYYQYTHTCAIKADGSLWCWGAGYSGELGNGDTEDQYLPVAVVGGYTWNHVSASGGITCAVRSDQKLFCWGEYEGSAVPVEVAGGGNWKYVDTAHHMCAIKADDTLWCWGDNWSGELGDGLYNSYVAPNQVSGGGTWKHVSTGREHTCGIKSDDTAWCWGYNSSGRLGDNTTTDRLAPVQVNGGGSWKAITAGDFETCAIKTDETLWCWGSGVLSPTAVAWGGTWKSVSAGAGHICAIKTDDTGWCWGWNMFGKLGDGTTTDRATAVQILGGNSWKQITTSYSSTCGVTTSGKALCWGRNIDGQLTSTEKTEPFSTVSEEPWCSDPSAEAGAIVYNVDYNVMQYCDGAGWVQVGR